MPHFKYRYHDMQKKILATEYLPNVTLKIYFYDEEAWNEYCHIIHTTDIDMYKGFYSATTNKIILGNFDQYRKHLNLAQSRNIGNYYSLSKDWYGFNLNTSLSPDLLFIDPVSLHYNTTMVEEVLADFMNLTAVLFSEKFKQIHFQIN